MEAEGWYRDPFGAHEDRWFSAGQPTDLVRDAHVEAHDAPPQSTYEGQLVEIDDTIPYDSRRADDGSEFSRGRGRAALNAAIMESLPLN